MRTGDGRHWSAGPSGYSFTKRYLGAFDEVRVIARVQDVPEPKAGWSRADGDGVTFAALPFYLGPVQYLKCARSAASAARVALGNSDALLMRVGSQIACIMEQKLKRGRPYGLEVIGDPLNVFAKGSTQHRLRPFWRWWFTRAQRRQCARACAVSYVTNHYLQRLYPSAKDAFTNSFLNMELAETWFREQPRRYNPLPQPFRIVTVGGLDQPYKGIDLLIRSVSECVVAGWNIELSIVGGGRLMGQLQDEARRWGIANRVIFHGSIGAGEPIREQLDKSHLFVLFSKTEGLPRAMIEAMARALPCVGSDVGGIPELIDTHCIVPRGDHSALTAKFVEMLSNPGLLEQASQANLLRATDYRESSLDGKRTEFLLHLRAATQNWLAKGRSN